MTENVLNTYRRTLTTLDEGETAWWYLGTGIVTVPEHPPIIVNHVETVMIYGAKTLDDTSYRVPWWEIGVFRDAITGEIASKWTNPLTGRTVEAARKFEEGPSGFSLRTDGSGGIAIFDAVQAFARLESAEVTLRDLGDRVCITQTEHKVRAFPSGEGIPELTEQTGSAAHTVLEWSASKADLATSSPSVPATGMYRLDIATPPWLGFQDFESRFSIHGIMHKAAMQEPLNPRGWAELQQLFPEYFEAGEIRPRWA